MYGLSTGYFFVVVNRMYQSLYVETTHNYAAEEAHKKATPLGFLCLSTPSHFLVASQAYLDKIIAEPFEPFTFSPATEHYCGNATVRP